MKYMKKILVGMAGALICMSVNGAAAGKNAAMTGAESSEVKGWKGKVEAMVDSGPRWLASRLQMRWNSRRFSHMPTATRHRPRQ